MKNGKIEKTYYAYLLPLVLVIVVLPLAVRLVRGNYAPTSYAWSSGLEYAGDVFLLVKRHILYCAMGLAAFFLLCFVLLRRKIFSGTKSMLWLAVYLGFAILSTITARNPSLALHGGAERYESIFVLAGYLFLFYYTYLVLRDGRRHSQEARRFLLRAFGVLSVLLGILGVMQICGLDPYQSAVFAKLCGLQDVQFLDSDRIDLSLYHSDYVGVMMVLLLPLDLSGALVEEKRGGRIFFLAAALLCLLCLFGSQSRMGVLCLICCGLLFSPLWLARVQIRRKVLLGTILCLLAVCGLFALVDQIQGHSLSARFTHAGTRVREDALFMETGEDGVSFRCKGTKTYRAVFNGTGADQELLLRDEEGQTVDPGTGELSDIEIRKRRISYAGKTLYGFLFSYRKQNCFVTNQWKDHGYYYQNNQGKLDQCVLAEDAFPLSWYKFASYRGFVWSKTLPLLKQTIWYGAGPDHFEGVFPNNDYTSRYYVYLGHVIYNKPHCWYLQMAVETGVLSAVAVLLFLCGRILQGMRLLWKKRTEAGTGWNMLAGGAFACTAYALMGIGNDSMLVTAPVFWVVLGYTCALLQPSETDVRTAHRK